MSQLDKLYKEARLHQKRVAESFAPKWWGEGEGSPFDDVEEYEFQGMTPPPEGSHYYNIQEDDPVATWIAESDGMNPFPWVGPDGSWGADYFSHGRPADRAIEGHEPDFESARSKANDWIQNHYKEQTYDSTDDMSDEEYEAFLSGG